MTATVNLEFARFQISVRPSRIHRWGVVAEETIPVNRRVIQYTGERVSRQAVERRPERSREYLFTLNRYWFLDGAVGGSVAEYINHSCDPNLRARLQEGNIWYVSRRAIEPAEELTSTTSSQYRRRPSLADADRPSAAARSMCEEASSFQNHFPPSLIERRNTMKTKTNLKVGVLHWRR